MNKYGSIFESQEVSEESLNSEEAVAAIAVITAIVDSSLEDLDTESLANILWDFQIFDEYSEEEVLEIVEQMAAIAKQEGLGALFNTANMSIIDEIILDAFAAGVVMLLDDKTLTIPTKKQPYIKQLQTALQLENMEAEAIIKDVINAIEVRDQLEEYTEESETIILDELGQQIYQSPLGNFVLPVPVNPDQEGKIQSQEGTVSFSDNIGTFLRIDYYPIPNESLEVITSQGEEAYLHSILIGKYLPQAIFAHVEDAEIKYTEYLKDDDKGYYYVLVDMPKGSTISKQEINNNAVRLDAYRGLLAFINGKFLYIFSSQRTFFDGDIPGNILEEADDIKMNILEFIETIEFS
ncbi:MAG: hypothetical protein F6K62_01950 [Sphaerospermopsis sp. SIO1G2]|nr:hypothetical protein [Sphaerospermopsis sp. SIO1G1]NET69839.1 hypothetical protein [Sphaerospermopsis sp. SIO1G2]